MESQSNLCGDRVGQRPRYIDRLATLVGIGAIGIASLVLYVMDYHQGNWPLTGASLATVMGAMINAGLSGFVLGPGNRYYLRGQYGHMAVVLCLLVAWVVLYFTVLAPAVVPTLTAEPFLLSLADNSYHHPLKPVAHVTIAFTLWSAFQLTFAERTIHARRQMQVETESAASSSRACWRRRRAQTGALMGVALAELHPWLLIPSLIVAVHLFVRFQRQLP